MSIDDTNKVSQYDTDIKNMRSRKSRLDLMAESTKSGIPI